MVDNPDPHGLRLRGARIAGRADLENITSTVSIELDGCLLDEGLNVGGAYLPVLALPGCHLEHSIEPPLDAGALTSTELRINQATITAHSKQVMVIHPSATIAQLLATHYTDLIKGQQLPRPPQPHHPDPP